MKIPASLALIISLLHVSLLAAAERPNIVVFLVDDLGFSGHRRSMHSPLPAQSSVLTTFSRSARPLEQH